MSAIPFESVVPGFRSIILHDAARRERYAPLAEGIVDPNRRLCLEAVLDAMVKAKFGKNVDLAKVHEGFRARQFEDVTTSDIATYTRQIFPIVTRTFWSLNLFNLIGTQPMSAPTGKIFYQDFRYVSSGGLYDPGLYSPGARVDQFIDPFYALSEECPEDTVRQIGMTITDEDITAETRRLNACWSDEVAQDLRAYFNMEMDSIMVQNLGDEVAREIDQDGLDKLVSGATAGNTNWSATPTGAYSGLDPKLYGATLWDALIDSDQLVWEAINRSTTWIVGNATSINRLRKLGAYKLVGPANGPSSGQSALEYQGLLGERWKVWQARHFPEGKILMGFQGSSFADTGAVYAPYVPLEVKDAVKDLTGANAYKTVRGVQTRGVTHVVNGDAFSTVTITA